MTEFQLSPEQWERAFQLFDSLRDKPPTDRIAVLENRESCVDKPLTAAYDPARNPNHGHRSRADADWLTLLAPTLRKVRNGL